MTSILYQKISNNKFEFTGTYVVSWLMSAETLHYSAKVIWKDSQKSWKRMSAAMDKKGGNSMPVSRYPGTNAQKISQLLSGLALENLIKCILIRKEPTLISPKGISKKIATHNLEKLFTEAKQKVTPKELDLIRAC